MIRSDTGEFQIQRLAYELDMRIQPRGVRLDKNKTATIAYIYYSYLKSLQSIAMYMFPLIAHCISRPWAFYLKPHILILMNVGTYFCNLSHVTGPLSKNRLITTSSQALACCPYQTEATISYSLNGHSVLSFLPTPFAHSL